MNFIELTERNGEKRLVNADMIDYIYPREDGIDVKINLSTYYFSESYSRLKEMLMPFYEVNFGGTNGELNCAKGEEQG